MDIVMVALFLAAAVLFGVETFTTRALLAAGLCLMAVAFTIGAFLNVA